MKVQANQIRAGWVIEHEGKQWSVLNMKLLQPGKGSAFIQVEMRDVNTGVKSNERWRTADTVEKLMMEERESQYLYTDGDNLVFMQKDNFEQFHLPTDAMGEQIAFLQESMDVVVDFIEGRPISVTLPKTVVLEIAETEPVVKGQTASSSYKPAKLENGARIMVPPFITAGEKVVVNTEECAYVERFKG